MKRAVPSEFPAKFRKHGVTPSQRYYVYKSKMNPDHCSACALGIEAIDVVGIEKANGHWYPELAAAAGLTHSYADGLDDGWQGRYARHTDNEEYNVGHADGKAAFLACIEAGLVPRTAP